MSYTHIPVLLTEVIELLDPHPGQNFVDATLGGGGYSRAILERNGPDGRLLGIDLDAAAIDHFKSQSVGPSSIPRSLRIEERTDSKNKNIILHQGNFKDIHKIVQHHTFENIAGIVADLGFSSYQLDQADRGFSFQTKAVLDMRLDQSSQAEDARFIVNEWDEQRLQKIFFEYGEEKFAKKIASKIHESRSHNPIKYTTDLAQIIQEALPKPVRHKAADSARRIFQALRIAVNHELENLEEFLPAAFKLLAPGGRLAVVTFHSLEDRRVKHYFQGLTKGCVCPPDFPQCICGRQPEGRLLRKKPVTASPKELAENPRAKPAKLRAIQKIDISL